MPINSRVSDIARRNAKQFGFVSSFETSFVSTYTRASLDAKFIFQIPVQILVVLEVCKAIEF